MNTTTLQNPWSKADVTITNDEAIKKLDSCMDEFATDEEKYTIETMVGVDAIDTLVREYGADRVADIWFS